MNDIAQRIFEARLLVSNLDDELYRVLCDEGGIEGCFEDWHFDHYDSSIEFDGCPPDFRLSAEHQKLLWSIGFMRCWLNHPDRHETYYYEGGSPNGYHQQKGKPDLSAVGSAGSGS